MPIRSLINDPSRQQTLAAHIRANSDPGIIITTCTRKATVGEMVFGGLVEASGSCLLPTSTTKSL